MSCDDRNTHVETLQQLALLIQEDSLELEHEAMGRALRRDRRDLARQRVLQTHLSCPSSPSFP